MPQKTMMWKGVALVEAPESTDKFTAICSECFFSHNGGLCEGSEHMLEAQEVFGGMCGYRNTIYIPAQPTKSDAEWVDARLADLLKEIASECGVCEEDFPYGYVRAALLEAIKRGRGE